MLWISRWIFAAMGPTRQVKPATASKVCLARRLPALQFVGTAPRCRLVAPWQTPPWQTPAGRTLEAVQLPFLVRLSYPNALSPCLLRKRVLANT